MSGRAGRSPKVLVSHRQCSQCALEHLSRQAPRTIVLLLLLPCAYAPCQYPQNSCCLYTPDANGHVDIPPGITSIGNSAFEDCQSLVTISLPTSVTSIGAYSFAHCRSLISVSLPSTLNSIAEGAFHKCRSLEATCVPTGCSVVTGSFRYTAGFFYGSHCDTAPSPPLPPLPPPLFPTPPLVPPTVPSLVPSPSCSSPSGRTYAFPCCIDPSRAYAGKWLNARWVGEAWFSPHACSCIIPQGTNLPTGPTAIDHCCY